ncbi:MAG: glycosyltransferase family 2 protein [Limnochordia bacterium]
MAAQTYRPLEIVVVNDGSTDNTDEVAKNWWKDLEDKNGLSFVYLSLPHNTGYASAQSIAYQLSTGEFIANQDSDDVSHPERLQNSSRFSFPTQTTASWAPTLQSFKQTSPRKDAATWSATGLKELKRATSTVAT